MRMNPEATVSAVRSSSARTELAALLVQAEDLLDRDASCALRLASELADGSGDDEIRTKATLLQGRALFASGRTDEGIDLLKGLVGDCCKADRLLPAAQALTLIANEQYKRGDYGLSLESDRKALALFEELGATKDSAVCLSRIGAVYNVLGELPQALEYARRGLDLLRQSDNLSAQAQCLNNIASIFSSLDDHGKAIDYLSESLALFRQLKDRSRELVCLFNLGIAEARRNNHAEAMRHFRQALQFADEAGDRRRKILILHNSAISLMDQGSTAEALAALEHCLEQANAIGDRNSVCLAHMGLGKTMLDSGDPEQAERHLMLALDHATATGLGGRLRDIYGALAQLHEETGDYRQALEYQRRLQEVQHKLFNEESAEKISKLQVIHEVEQAHKKTEIHRLKNVELQRVNQELEQLMAEKNEFLGIAAHDLKNPIATIKALAKLLRTQYKMLSAEDFDEQCRDIEFSADRMLNIVSDLLELNRIEQGQLSLNLAPFDLNTTLAAYIDIARFNAAEKNITLHYQAEASTLHCLADVDATIRIIDNLVSNAVKYSEPGSEVYVLAGANEAQPALLRFQVRDQGPGISAEDMQRLFQKFARLSARPTAGEDSTGLGLSIVKRLVEAMGGRVWCESESGKGACFIVELQAASDSD